MAETERRNRRLQSLSLDIKRDIDLKLLTSEQFKEFARQHGRKTQAEMAQAWNEDISARTIGSCLKKIGFTRKKNLWVPRKG